MTKSYFFSFLLLVSLLSACSGSIRTDYVDFTQGFTDGNSKVWMVEKTISPDGAVMLKHTLRQDIYVFYQSGNCLLTNLQKLALGKGRHGRLTFDHEKHYVTMIFPDEKREFEFEFTNENQLILYPLEGSDYTNAMELIPFPEFR
jgi:hypothetical protein